MKKRTANEIRQLFLEFFKEKNHAIEPSAPLVPQDDPSLLWINSGVATLKKYFDGREIPNNPRIANVQKSIRTNDIENVGKTARHHTFFEMLGNFSIGDYFKREAILWAWEFLTSEQWLGFSEKKLFVTIHPDDEDAFNIWHEEVGLPKERIVRLEENFWDIGEGPSGPNTEIFYDRGPKYGNDPDDPELYPGGENERFLEIWNLVFSQFNHNPDGSYTPLPKKNIDTGMGLERMASVIQDVPTNFDTDLFLPIIRATEQLTSISYLDNEKTDEAFKVIADHIRTCTFAISDGALPSNEGRGYVLRRLLRRAVRYAKMLHINKPFMHKLVTSVAETMQDAYPDVLEKSQFIQKVIHTEEERFHETLNEGLHMLSSIVMKLKSENKTVISGADVFRLYDTYGFPYELTKEYAEEENLSIDIEGFEKEMAKQRERARSARQTSNSMQVQSEIYTDMAIESDFVGYDDLANEAVVEAIISHDEFITEAVAGDEVQVILSETPFYAESGGQIADQGRVYSDTMRAVVTDVQKAPTGQHLHTIRIEEGSLRKAELVRTEVNRDRRAAIIKNHTATHLLHQALKDVLGDHIEQKGSLVAHDRLRFDFSHFNQISAEELAQIEVIVNEKIWANLPLVIMQKELEEAKRMGAMALFGEKYEDIVRVVQIGDYSLELCGGCHVTNTAEIGLFTIVAESGIGAGVRRIEAVTGKSAYQYLAEQFKHLQEVAGRLNTTIDGVSERVEQLQKQVRSLQKENESLGSKLGHLEAKNLTTKLVDINGVNVIATKVTVKDMGALRKIVDELKQSIQSGVIILATVQNGKVSLAAGVTEDLIKRGFHAGQLVKFVSEQVGGGGGGRPDMAQAGGKNPENVDAALKSVEDWVKSIS